MAKPTTVYLWDSSNLNITPAPTVPQIAAGFSYNAEAASSHFNCLFKSMGEWNDYTNKTAAGAGGIGDDLAYIGSNLLTSNNTWTGSNEYTHGTTANTTVADIARLGAVIGNGYGAIAGVYGTSDTGNGGYFRSSSTAGQSAVNGYANGATGTNVGGSFTATSGYGVLATGSLIGAIGSGATGLQGQGVTRGGNFTASNTVNLTNAYGLVASCISAGTGERTGIWGIGITYGVSGEGTQSGSVGVYGAANMGTGVKGYDDGDGVGVEGYVSGSGHAVWGHQLGAGAGVYGQSASGYGVYGTSATGDGIYAAVTGGTGYALKTSSGAGNAIHCDGWINMAGGNTGPGVAVANKAVADNQVKAYGIVTVSSAGVVTMTGGFNASVPSSLSDTQHIYITLLAPLSDEVGIVTVQWDYLTTWTAAPTIRGTVKTASGGATLDVRAYAQSDGSAIMWNDPVERSFKFMVVGRQ